MQAPFSGQKAVVVAQVYVPDEGRKPLEGGAQVRLLDGHVEGVEEQAGTRKPHLPSTISALSSMQLR